MRLIGDLCDLRHNLTAIAISTRRIIGLESYATEQHCSLYQSLN
uniref:Uncharacterized protein n=1 Tax=Desertifilum tharense IPPAS B-1220 TaxID=1781255 RepID=A0ACD5H337_9CYAN